MRHRHAALFASLLTLACTTEPTSVDGTDEGGPTGPADDPSSLDESGGEEAQPTCEATNLRSLERPVDPADPYGPSFTWFYQHLDRDDGSGPTIIHVPGGPGGTSIGETLGIPETVDLVLTDPRGVGCNAAGAPHEADFYGTEKFASDVLAIVRDLELEDYIVYGHSYGTVLGTVVASKAEAEGLPPPRLVVLEGIVGPAIETDDGAYRALWPVVRDALPEDVRAQLLADPLPLGRSPRAWGETITGVLSQFSPDVLFELLMGLGEGGDTMPLEGLLAAIGDGPPTWENEEMMGLFRPVACTEIAEHSWFGFELVGGEVVPTVDACAEIELDTPYDPADWPIAAPILYFEGTQDPATTPMGARAHFDAQRDTDRTFVSVTGVGHTPLLWRINGGCGPSIWTAVLDGSDLQAALTACNVDATVEHAAAGE